MGVTISWSQGLFPSTRERGWDGESSISRGRAHILIFVFTDRKNNRFQKKSTLQNTNILKWPLRLIINRPLSLAVASLQVVRIAKHFSQADNVKSIPVTLCFSAWFPCVLPTIGDALMMDLSEVSESEKYSQLAKNITYQWSRAIALGLHDRLSYMLENYKYLVVKCEMSPSFFSGIVREVLNKWRCQIFFTWLYSRASSPQQPLK